MGFVGIRDMILFVNREAFQNKKKKMSYGIMEDTDAFSLAGIGFAFSFSGGRMSNSFSSSVFRVVFRGALDTHRLGRRNRKDMTHGDRRLLACQSGTGGESLFSGPLAMAMEA